MRLPNLQIYNITQMQGLRSRLHWCKTARKLGTRLNEYRKSVQACYLKSAVSENAKDTGHSIDWASVKIIGQENHLLSHKIHESISIHAYSVAGNELAWSGLFKEQFCSLIKMRLWITATVITDEEIQMGSESSAKLSTIIVGVKVYFFVISIIYFDYLLDY